MNRRELLRAGSITTAAGLVLPTTGCATLLQLLGQFVKMPQLSIKSMKIQKASLSTLSTRFVVAINNPNDFGFNLAGLDYLLNLAGGAVAQGTARKGIALKPRAKSETELDIDFDLAKTAAAILELLGQGTIPYGLETTAHFQAQNQTIPVPAKLEGKMPMPKIPKFEIANFAVTSASLSGVQFRVDTALDNLNPFDVPIDAFGFDIKMGGRSVLKNKTLAGTRLKAGKKSSVPLNFTVGLADLGLSIAELARNPRLNWEVDTDVKSGILKLPFNQKGSVKIA